MDDGRRITGLESVPDDTTFLFQVRDRERDERTEAILVRTNGEVAGWLNYCQHVTHINLDKGSGAPMRNGELVCENHGAYFEADTGYCTYGPCEGAFLPEVDVAVHDDAVYLTDDDYAFVATGPIDDDDHDLVSTSNLEF